MKMERLPYPWPFLSELGVAAAHYTARRLYLAPLGAGAAMWAAPLPSHTTHHDN